MNSGDLVEADTDKLLFRALSSKEATLVRDAERHGHRPPLLFARPKRLDENQVVDEMVGQFQNGRNKETRAT